MPLFSLVLPTLKRPDTFRHALATLTRQAFDDFEIVVQNNGRDPATEAIVNESGDPRIRHFWSDTTLTMSENWEVALANARGEFITFIGDDDGLFPDACAVAARLIGESGLEIVSWRPFCYYWPNYQRPHLRNRLLATIDYDVRADMIRSAHQLKLFYGFHIDYSELPMIYNSFIHRAVIERARAQTGTYFIGYSPDVVSGIVNAALSEQFALLSRPLSMTGISQHSTGHGLFASGAEPLDANRVARDFGELSSFDNLLAAGNLQLFIAHDMLSVRDKILRNRGIPFHYYGMLAAAAAAINDRPERYPETRAAIEQLARRHGVDVASIDIPAPMERSAVLECGATFLGEQKVNFVIDGEQSGIAHIHDAVRLVEQLRPRADGDIPRLEMLDRVMLEAGQPVFFGRAAGTQSALQHGWGAIEEWGVWSVAERAALTATLAATPASAFNLTLVYRSFLHAAHRAIRIECFVRDRKIADWTIVSPRGAQHLTIPRASLSPDGSFTLEFVISEPRSPAELGASEDRRKLGIGIESIVLNA